MNLSRRKFLWTVSCISMLIGLFVGCANPTDGPAGDTPASGKKTWTVKFAGIPDDCAKGLVTVKGYDKDGIKVDSVTLGEITPSDIMSKSFELDPSVLELDVLIDGNTSYEYQYFTVFDLSKVSGTELRNYYWVDYYYYAYRGEIHYGLNSADVVISQNGKTIVGDFTDAPFYVCKIENVKGKNIQLVADSSTVNVVYYDTSDITNLGSSRRSESFNYSSVNACTASDGALYIMCEPDDYSKSAKVNVQIVDQTDSVPGMKAHCFVPEDAVSIDGKTVYLYSEDSKTLKKWVLATDTITDAYQFSHEINRIATDGSGILVAAGSSLYSYNPQENTTTTKYTASEYATIPNFCLLGSNRIVAFEVPLMSSGSPVLLDKTQQSYVKIASTAKTTGIPVGDMLAVIGSDPTQRRIYYGNAYKTLYYVDVSSDKVGDPVEIKATKDIGGVKQLGSDAIVTKNGEVFSIAGGTPVYTSFLATSIDDILPQTGKNLALVTAVDSASSTKSCFLMTYSLTSPYEKLKKSGSVKYEIGINLLATQEGIFMVSRQTSGVYMFGFNYCPVHITKIDDVDAVVSQSFSLAGAKPAVMNGERRYSTLGLGSVAGGNR